MNNIADALTHKIGPLPGYAWAALAAGAIVLIGTLTRGKGSPSSSTGDAGATSFLTLPPQTDIGGGGGGAATPGDTGSGDVGTVIADPVADPVIDTGTTTFDTPSSSSTSTTLDGTGSTGGDPFTTAAIANEQPIVYDSPVPVDVANDVVMTRAIQVSPNITGADVNAYGGVLAAPVEETPVIQTADPMIAAPIVPPPTPNTTGANVNYYGGVLSGGE